MAGDAGDVDEEPPNASGLAARIRALVDDKRNPATGRRYTVAEIEAAIRERAATLPAVERKHREISGTYVWQLSRGYKTNPTLGALQSLADFLEVSLTDLIEPQTTAETLQLQADISKILRNPFGREAIAMIATADAGLWEALLPILRYSTEMRSSGRQRR